MTQRQSSEAPMALTPVQQALAAEAVDFIARVAKIKGRRAARLLGEDLTSIAQLAQVEAARDYDPSVGPYRTYVVWRVYGAILNACKKEAPHVQARVYRVYEAACEHLAGVTDPWRPLDDTEADFRRHSDEFGRGVLASAFLREVGEVLRAEGEDGHAQRQLYRRAIEALREETAKLSKRDQEILYLHYGEELDLKVIAARKGMGYSTLRRHHERILVELAAKLAERGILNMRDTGFEP